MPQIFVHPENISDDAFTLDPKESHHVATVLRKKAGDQITLFDGKGRRFIGELTSATQGRIVKNIIDQERKISVSLFQGLPRGSKFDYVIEKATELGVDSIVPFLSEKNPVKGGEKIDRWVRLAEAASKQCGRSTVPTIAPAKKLTDLTFLGADSLLFDTENAAPLRSALQGKTPEKINVIIGPESGFSNGERAWLIAQGCRPVSLGPLVLRTETAGLVALSLINYELF